MKQLKVALPDSLRASLEESAKRSGRSLADEIRTRLERTFIDDTAGLPIRALLYAIEHLAKLVQVQTGYEWHVHPIANDTLLAAITSRFARIRPKDVPAGEPPVGAGRFVASNDPKLVGPALEAVAFIWPMSESDIERIIEGLRLAFEKARGRPIALTDPEFQQWLTSMLESRKLAIETGSWLTLLKETR
jgi:hypothetical protein